MKIYGKNVLLPEGFMRDGVVTIENGTVTGIAKGNRGDLHCEYVVPGLVDQHIHGGYGVDVTDADVPSLVSWLDFLFKNGDTHILFGLSTHSPGAMRGALQTCREIMAMQKDGARGARVDGVHLEGPFINPSVPGAMRADAVLEPTIENYQRIAEGYEDIVRLVTLAPEVRGAGELIRYLVARGVKVEAGHTAANSEEALEAFENGIDGITHFFNASTPIRHREPGILAEALVNEDIYCEVIGDFVHLHPTSVKLIATCKLPDRMILISDAVSTAGLPDGEYGDGADAVVVRGGVARTEKGALAGGASVLIEQVRNMIRLGMAPEHAFRAASTNPARYLNISGGNIFIGGEADLLCLDGELKPMATILGEK